MLKRYFNSCIVVRVANASSFRLSDVSDLGQFVQRIQIDEKRHSIYIDVPYKCAQVRKAHFGSIIMRDAIYTQLPFRSGFLNLKHLSMGRTPRKDRCHVRH